MLSVYLLKCTENINNYRNLLRKERLEKAASFKRPKDGLLSIGAGLLLRHAMSEYGISYDDSLFSRNEFGKPFIPDCPFHFSLSHSGQYALCAVSDREIGCDIQLITDNRESIAHRFFHPNEISYLNSISDEDRRRIAFFRIWTIKESYVKLDGRGLSCPFDSFYADLQKKVPVICPCGTDSETSGLPVYYIKEYDSLKNYCISCVSTDPIFPQKVREICEEQL